MLSRCFLDFSVGVRASVIGLSQISFFSPKMGIKLKTTFLGDITVIIIIVIIITIRLINISVGLPIKYHNVKTNLSSLRLFK